MGMTPIETMMNDVEWLETDAHSDPNDDLPIATHRGVLRIMGVEMECFRLSTGQSVVSEDRMHRFLEFLNGKA